MGSTVKEDYAGGKVSMKLTFVANTSQRGLKLIMTHWAAISVGGYLTLQCFALDEEAAASTFRQNRLFTPRVYEKRECRILRSSSACFVTTSVAHSRRVAVPYCEKGQESLDYSDTHTFVCLDDSSWFDARNSQAGAHGAFDPRDSGRPRRPIRLPLASNLRSALEPAC